MGIPMCRYNGIRLWTRLALWTGLALPIILAVKYPNEIEDQPQIECGDGKVRITVKTTNGVATRLFAKGHYSDTACSFERTNSGSFSIGECGMNRQRQLDPRGVTYGLVVVVQLHPMFVTSVDRAYSIKCFYMETDKIVTSLLDVSMMSTQSITGGAPMPSCVYELHAESPNGPAVRYARVGDMVWHTWTCPSDTFGMLVHSCVVTDGQGNDFKIIDAKGCGVDQYVLRTPEYSEDLTRVQQETHVFKFADRTAVMFNCQIKLCQKSENGCNGISPPVCFGSSGAPVAGTTSEQLVSGTTPSTLANPTGAIGNITTETTEPASINTTLSSKLETTTSSGVTENVTQATSENVTDELTGILHNRTFPTPPGFPANASENLESSETTVSPGGNISETTTSFEFNTTVNITGTETTPSFGLNETTVSPDNLNITTEGINGTTSSESSLGYETTTGAENATASAETTTQPTNETTLGLETTTLSTSGPETTVSIETTENITLEANTTLGHSDNGTSETTTSSLLTQNETTEGPLASASENGTDLGNASQAASNHSGSEGFLLLSKGSIGDLSANKASQDDLHAVGIGSGNETSADSTPQEKKPSVSAGSKQGSQGILPPNKASGDDLHSVGPGSNGTASNKAPQVNSQSAGFKNGSAGALPSNKTSHDDLHSDGIGSGEGSGEYIDTTPGLALANATIVIVGTITDDGRGRRNILQPVISRAVSSSHDLLKDDSKGRRLLDDTLEVPDIETDVSQSMWVLDQEDAHDTDHLSQNKQDHKNYDPIPHDSDAEDKRGHNGYNYQSQPTGTNRVCLSSKTMLAIVLPLLALMLLSTAGIVLCFRRLRTETSRVAEVRHNFPFNYMHKQA